MSASPSLRSECTLSRHGRRGVWRPISAHAAIVQAALHSNALPNCRLVLCHTSFSCIFCPTSPLRACKEPQPWAATAL